MKEPSTLGKRQCPKCGRWADVLWLLEGDEVGQGVCADCILKRRRERQQENRKGESQ